MQACECTPMLEKWFPRPIAEIVRLYAGSITRKAVNEWFLENELEFMLSHKTKLYCRYHPYTKKHRDGNELSISLDSAGFFGTNFKRILIMNPLCVARFLRGIDDAYAALMLATSVLRIRDGDSTRARDLRMPDRRSSETIHVIRAQLNLLGLRMGEQLIPQCAHMSPL
jgi:hypothetical protein